MTTTDHLDSRRTTSQHHSTTAPSMVEPLDRLLQVVESCGRADLSARLSLARTRVADPRLRIVATGQKHNGISSIANALAGQRGTETSSEVPVIFAHGATESTKDVLAPQGHVLRTEVNLPNDLLAQGVVLVDMPGTGIERNRTGSMIATIPSADATDL